MNRNELIQAISAKTGWDKKEAAESLEAVLGAVTESLVELEDVTIPGFGTFKVADRKERQGRNPQTGEAVTIPASIAVTFKPSAKLKDVVNGR